jgi:HAD superfamily hydrolase (TIGR01549 family)
MTDQLFDTYHDFIFDLDNTLYREEDYLFAAYKNIAQYLGIKYRFVPDVLFDFLADDFRTNGHSGVFDRFLGNFSIPVSEMEHLLSLQRTVECEIPLSLFPASAALLKQLIALQKKIFIITNGNVQQQQNKIRQINWEGLLPHLNLIYANAYEAKPATGSYTYLVSTFGITKPVYIGDSETDALFAQNCAIPFIFINQIIHA